MVIIEKFIFLSHKEVHEIYQVQFIASLIFENSDGWIGQDNLIIKAQM